nr:apolipoprotein N-acyltransferase [Deinococcus aerophilus]
MPARLTRPTRPVPVPLVAAALGLLLAACSPPLPWSALAALPLAGVLAYAALAPRAGGVAARLFWSGTGYFAVHLWWLTAFLGKLFGVPPAGALAFALFALEGAFLALMAYPLARGVRSPAARVWALAGGWVVLEWTRFLGPLAFPWPTLGYGLLPTPAIQIADLGGVLLGSVLVALSAAALASFALGRNRWGRGRPLLLAAVAWAAALLYGVTRVPGDGPVQPMLTLRTSFDSFGRATRDITPEEQLATQQAVSLQRTPEEVLIWSETALSVRSGVPQRLPTFPGPGITGLGVSRLPQAPNLNGAAAVDAVGQVTSFNVKAKLVPFGEFFPLYAQAPALYAPIEQMIGFPLQVFAPAESLTPLTLNGVQYGTYICYDSVFPWVARTLTAQGAQVLVNPSNDGWYNGWGVRQHFMMGRVRAIENRRWLVRSVNRGIAGSVDDLGRPVNILESGEQTQALSVRPKLLTGTTVYTRVGDWPALLLALLMVGYAIRLDRRR